MGVLTRSRKQEKPQSHAKSIFLKIVRPGGQVELFRDPIMAREIMRRYPRHCVTRPDFFDYPWVVVRPDSVLELGGVYFLVPHHTVDKVTKDKMHEFQQSLDRPLHQPPGAAPGFRPIVDRRHHDHRSNESWEEMRRRLEQLQPEREDSPSETQRLSHELVLEQRGKTCLRKAEDGRKRLDLKVRFSCPIVIPGGQRGTPIYTM